jgi:aspartate/methionine/tyrosine aminotransferase
MRTGSISRIILRRKATWTCGNRSAFLQRTGSSWTYAPEEILVASGGRPLIYSLFRTVVDPGDKVIYAVPSWNNNHYTHLNGGEHVVIEATAENNFMPTAEAIRPYIKGAALLCLCSPQNPTGTTISRKDLSAICELVLEENARRTKAGEKLYVLYDQMYWQLTYGNIVHYNPVSLYPAMREYTVFVDAISKVFAATGVRIGWAMGPAPIMKKDECDHEPYRELGADGRAEGDGGLFAQERGDRCLFAGVQGRVGGPLAPDP